MSKNTEFTIVSGTPCKLVTIQAVFPIDTVANEGLSDLLEQFQQYGTAEVVRVDVIAESFHEACKILDGKSARLIEGV